MEHSAAKPERYATWIRIVLALNLLDLLFTVYYIESGLAVEANPLLAAAYNVSPAYFATVKMSLAVLGLTLLYKNRKSALAWTAVRGLAAAYALVAVYHVAHLPLNRLSGALVGLLSNTLFAAG